MPTKMASATRIDEQYSEAREEIGTLRHEGGDVYMFVENDSGSDISADDALTFDTGIDSNGDVAAQVQDAGTAGAPAGYAAADIDDGNFGWTHLHGFRDDEATAGGTISNGAAVTFDGSGNLDDASAGDYVVGVALEDEGSSTVDVYLTIV